MSAAPPPGRLPLTIVVLTHNEEGNLPACLAGLQGLDAPVVVVDSGSTDATVQLAVAHGARILSHAFESHAAQWRWALANLPVSSEWVLGLDADQQLTPELRNEIGRLLGAEAEACRGIDGFYIKRRQVFRGRWIRHGGYYPKYLLKLFRASKVVLDEKDLLDHHFYIRGRAVKLKNDLIEANRKEDRIGFWSEKHVRYASLLAHEELGRRCGDAPWAIEPSVFGTPDQRVAWLKQRWYRMPLYVRPFVYFLYRYVLRLGFLDGKQGFIFHFLQGFWYRLLVDISLDELLSTDARGGK